MAKNPPYNKATIAYVLGEFPSRTETFIAHEIVAMSAYFNIIILAMSGEGTTPPGIPVIRLPQLRCRKVWIGHLALLVCHPRRYLRSVTQCVGKRGRIRCLKAFYKSVYFEKHIGKYKIDHLHAHFATAPTDVAIALSRLTGLPYSFSAHAHDIYVKNPSLADKMTEAAFVVTCTHYNKTRLDQLVPPEIRTKIFTVYHGLPLSKWPFEVCPQNQHDLPAIISVGRLVKKKGFQYLGEALGILKEKGYRFHWYIVGEGPERKALSNLAKDYQLVDSVHLLGWRSQAQIRQLFARNSLLVQPSVVAPNGDRDGIPNVILEAMASGVPVVATLMPSIMEVLSPDKGLLVPQKDPHTLAEAILKLSSDHALRERVVTRARDFTEKIDVGMQTQQLAQIIQASVKKSR